MHLIIWGNEYERREKGYVESWVIMSKRICLCYSNLVWIITTGASSLCKMNHEYKPMMFDQNSKFVRHFLPTKKKFKLFLLLFFFFPLSKTNRNLEIKSKLSRCSLMLKLATGVKTPRELQNGLVKPVLTFHNEKLISCSQCGLSLLPIWEPWDRNVLTSKYRREE